MVSSVHPAGLPHTLELCPPRNTCLPPLQRPTTACRPFVAGVRQLPVCPQARHICLPGSVVDRDGWRPGGVHQDSSTQVGVTDTHAA